MSSSKVPLHEKAKTWLLVPHSTFYHVKAYYIRLKEIILAHHNGDKSVKHPNLVQIGEISKCQRTFTRAWKLKKTKQSHLSF